ncbi:MAG: hypothetical protein AAF570_12830 [Bacteroidota bacterium]
MNLTFRQAFLAVLVMMCFAFGTSRAVAQQYTFQTAPYDSAYTNLMAGNGVPQDSIFEVLNFSRPGKSDVDMVFLRNQFYLIFDLSGTESVYILSYFDNCEDYASEFQFNGIDAATLTVNQLLNGLLRYYNKP